MEKIKIMIIDDSTTIGRTAEIFLSDPIYEIIKAVDGLEGLSMIDEVKPNLIFIDIVMPKVNGIQTCQLIKRHPEYKKIPLVFLSSKSGEFEKAKGKFVGADDYLTKPFTKEQITNTVKKYTDHLIKNE